MVDQGLNAVQDSRTRALVVDDEPAICEYLADVLQDMGLDVYCAHDVQSALRIAGDESPLDVAFIDLALPDRSGLELIAELHRSQPDLPIVGATTYAARASAGQDGSSHGKLVLGKPYDEKSISDVMRRLGLGPAP